MNALNGTGVESETAELLLLLPPPPDVALVAPPLPELPPADRAEPFVVPVSTLVLIELDAAVDRAEVELGVDPPIEVVVDRLRTEAAAPRPVLLLEDADSKALPEDAVVPDPAPEDDPAVLEDTAVELPPAVYWMYRSRSPAGFC
jgi:hypothetical protein